MDYIKASLFVIFLVIWTITISVLGCLTFVSYNRKFITKVVGGVWAAGINYYLKNIIKVKVVVEGEENLPSKPFIVACKHQSAWETIFLIGYFSDPAFILKKELTYIPFFGMYLNIMGMIPIERGKASAIKKISIKVREVLKQNRVLVIFPEGTRVAPYEDASYKSGVYMIHKASPETPIVPAALNSGHYWPKGSYLIKSGTIKLKFMPPLEESFSKEKLISSLKKIIDEESNKL